MKLVKTSVPVLLLGTIWSFVVGSKQDLSAESSIYLFIYLLKLYLFTLTPTAIADFQGGVTIKRKLYT